VFQPKGTFSYILVCPLTVFGRALFSPSRASSLFSWQTPIPFELPTRRTPSFQVTSFHPFNCGASNLTPRSSWSVLESTLFPQSSSFFFSNKDKLAPFCRKLFRAREVTALYGDPNPLIFWGMMKDSLSFHAFLTRDRSSASLLVQ